jgi:hypothetical protein
MVVGAAAYVASVRGNDPHVMRGLQELIPGRRTNVTITNGGKKVSMLLAQARKQLKGHRSEGRKKSPPEQFSISEHMPPASNFISNVSNRAWRNRLSPEPMNVHQEAARKTAASSTPAPAAEVMATMTERVQKRVLDVFLNASTTSPTKKIAAKVHAQLACKDAAFTSVVDQFQDVQCSQEISSVCLELQREMD